MPGSWHVMLFIMIFNLWLSQVAGTPHNANLKAIENGYGICIYIYIYIYILCAESRYMGLLILLIYIHICPVSCWKHLPDSEWVHVRQIEEYIYI